MFWKWCFSRFSSFGFPYHHYVFGNKINFILSSVKKSKCVSNLKSWNILHTYIQYTYSFPQKVIKCSSVIHNLAMNNWTYVWSNKKGTLQPFSKAHPFQIGKSHCRTHENGHMAFFICSSCTLNLQIRKWFLQKVSSIVWLSTFSDMILKKKV